MGLTSRPAKEKAMSDKLRECPFCGSFEGPRIRFVLWGKAVVCRVCGARGTIGRNNHDAAMCWNQRGQRKPWEKK